MKSGISFTWGYASHGDKRCLEIGFARWYASHGTWVAYVTGGVC